MFDWSKYQLDIFEEMRSGTQHVIVEAKAGSSKTTSLVEALKYIPDGQTWLLVAFNKIIAEELKQRAPQSFSGEIKTLHSQGLKALYRKFPRLKVDNKKIARILDTVLGKDKKLYDVKYQIEKTVSLCKGYLIEGAELIDFVMDDHDIDTCDMDRDIFIDTVQKTIELSGKDTSAVDFNDMIWFHHIYKTDLPKYHNILIDEGQDLNRAQFELAIKSCKRNGRIFIFADQKQGLYEFRGASLDNIENIKKRLNAKTLPLSISYRCPKAVIREAQTLVPDIEAAPNAIEGQVVTIAHHEMMKQVKPGAVILSRANAPMVPVALKLLRKGVPAFIKGKDIGSNLLNLIKKSRRKNLPSFLDWLENWEKKEVERLTKKNRDFSLVQDKAACLRALADACPTLDELKKKIKELFEDLDDKDKVQLSTVHKFKGLEAEEVYLLKNTFRYNSQGEKNIVYVAITRSRKSVYYVTGK